MSPTITRDPMDADVVVVGSGAAGLAAAVKAADDGLSVTVIEKAEYVGGSTCYSAGMVWIPKNRQAQSAGIVDSADAAFAYLEAEGGTRLQREAARVYVDQAADIIGWYEDHTHAQFALSPAWPDYHPAYPGSCPGGRALGPKPFDGRTLGARFAELRPPLATTMILGGMMVGREDLTKFYTILKSWSSFVHVGKLFARYCVDRLSYPRGTRLSNGNALIAALARSALDRGVAILTKTPMTDLIIEGGRVTGVKVQTASGVGVARARLGVLLASGGFPANDEIKRRFMPHLAQGKSQRTLAPAANSGDAFRIGERHGVGLVVDQTSPVSWTPVSLMPQKDGSTIPFPHFNDRGKAGYIAVDKRGKRFISEARSYHDFCPAMIKACENDADAFCWVICDDRAVHQYGLGAAPPPPGRLDPHVRSGYIKRAPTLAALAAACGLDAAGLQATVDRWNRGADRGVDEEFGKGTDVYEKFNGSLGQKPNPCVAPIATGPYWAIRLIPGDLGSFAGLHADASARALDTNGNVIDGLYIAGNDAGAFMAGAYPGAGTSIEPAMVFGYVAATHMATKCAAGVA